MRSLDIVNKTIGFWSSKPALVSFFASLLLSLIAAFGASTIGRDAAFYLDIALAYEESGWRAAYERFNWPWYSILVGSLHKLTALPLVPLAYTVNAMFMAATCALLVKLVQDRFPAAAWWACLVVLAMPAFNDYRDDIWREFGFWFFCVLALYAAVTWSERGGWWYVLTIYAATSLAALFRLEALFLMVAICSWQAFSIRNRTDLFKALQIALPPAGFLALGSLFLLAFLDESNFSRLVFYLRLLNPLHIVESLDALSAGIADSMESGFSRNEAGEIAFFGIVGTLAYGFIKSLGVFIIPYFSRIPVQERLPLRPVFALFGQAFFFYFIVLFIFFLQLHFTTGRYSSFLAMLAIPLTSVACYCFSKRFPRAGKILITMGLISMLANVVSLSPGRVHYKEAALWIKENAAPDSRVYFLDRRIAFYAGAKVEDQMPTEWQAITQHLDDYDYFVLESPDIHTHIKPLVSENLIQSEARFENKDGRYITVFSSIQTQ